MRVGLYFLEGTFAQERFRELLGCHTNRESLKERSCLKGGENKQTPEKRATRSTRTNNGTNLGDQGLAIPEGITRTSREPWERVAL